MTGHTADKMRKELIKIFKNAILSIHVTIETNLIIVDFLDVTFNLEKAIIKHHKNPNDEPQYVNRSSNHPPIIIRNIPSVIGKRISSLSWNKTFSKLHY